ncbi:hypothetical protein [Mycolicibacterium pulveris]|uniref:hypothetical protein n=1 Tax=Mycolicibacterium pulveris TaxID=36813 RepID=UPI003CF8CBAB
MTTTTDPEVIGYGGYTITGPDGAAGVFTALWSDGTRTETPMPSIEHLDTALSKLTELRANVLGDAEHLRDLGL